MDLNLKTHALFLLLFYLELHNYIVLLMFECSPLTTLRDNLVVTLKDGLGNDISHSGVETKLVVEKGLWDGLFPLEGGGYVHLRLQFILSEEDRNRIRSVRESALKKKHAELLHNNITSSRITRSRSDLGLSVLSPASSQDTQSRHVHVEDACQKYESAQSGSLLSPINISKKEGTLDQKQKAPNDTDRSKDLSLLIPKRREVFHVTASCERVTVEQPETPLTSSGSIVTESSSLSFSNFEQDSTHSSEKQSPLEKTPTNIRKMISAFESSLAQDKKPHISAPTTKMMPNKTAFKVAPKDKKEPQKESNMAMQLGPRRIRRIRSPFLTGEIQQHSDNPVQSSELSERIHSKYLKAIEKNVTGEEQMKEHIEEDEERRFHEHSSRKSLSEATQSSGYKVGEISEIQQHFKKFTDERTSSETSATQESASEVRLMELQTVQRRGSSCNELKLMKTTEKGQCCFVSRHGWMFPCEARHRCITMASKKVINLLEGFSAEAEIHMGNKISSQGEAMKEDGVQGSASNSSEDAKSSREQQSLRPQSREDDQTPTGPFEQAIKISIMVGFGILVLLTRQRKLQ
ncbi:hypothetical protein RJ641_025930 [Dillenia turbinata]|uniref:Uncharacterized protein n=1 Tax=Dillenia turbinata TaxID=194707 RepID=A0AAN8W1V1_9MAGN